MATAVGRTFVIRLAPGETAPRASVVFEARKTMYGGKDIGIGDAIFVFADGADGACVVTSRGRVTAVAAVPRKVGIARQTPRVTVTVEPTARATQRLDRLALESRPVADATGPEHELHFKFFRQATPKIGGISREAAAFLDRFF